MSDHEYGCQAKVGLLSLRDCDRMSAGTCSQCQIRICNRHGVLSDEGQMLCPECAADRPELKRKEPARRSRMRRGFYSRYGNRYGGYSPYYFGAGYGLGHSPYSYRDSGWHGSDQSAFDQVNEAPGEGVGPDGGMGDVFEPEEPLDAFVDDGWDDDWAADDFTDS